MYNLELTTTDALIEELKTRAPTGIILLGKQEVDATLRFKIRRWGDSLVQLGLMHILSMNLQESWRDEPIDPEDF